MRFAVTCWAAMQYGDVLDAGTVLAILRRYQGTAGDPAAAAAAIAAIQAGGPVGPAHLQAIAAALEDDGQAVSTAGEPQEADAATDYTVELLTGADDADHSQGAAPGGDLAGLLAEARHALAGLTAPDAGNGSGGEIDAGRYVAGVLRRLAAELDENIPSASGHGPVTALFSRGEAGCPAGAAAGAARDGGLSSRQAHLAGAGPHPDGPGHEPGARFTLDEARARTWLRHAVAACMADLDGDEPPADLGPRPAGELPEIGSDWNPVSPGQEDEVYQLVRRAVDSGIIGKPAKGIDLDFEYVDDTDGGYYYFLVRLSWKLKLATHAYEMRKLGEPDATGIEAALAILNEAVTSANSVLDENAAQGGIVLARAQLREWAGLGRDLTGHELARLARCIPRSSIPGAVGTIVSEAMGLAGDAADPGEEDRHPPR
jgi:hypothetical protein